jgi:hypothetical protein
VIARQEVSEGPIIEILNITISVSSVLWFKVWSNLEIQDQVLRQKAICRD